MIYLITLIIVITVFALVLRNLQNSPVEARRKGYWRLGIAVTMMILVLLIITGRMHWIGALAGLLLPVGKMLFHTISEHYLRKNIGNITDKETEHGIDTMSAEEARAILDVGADATRDMIESAYKTLMQKLHPDRGGNNYLAAKLNKAREVLLREIDS